MTDRELRLARAEGYRAGHADKLLGQRSDLTLGREVLPATYHNAYSEGYDQGWREGKAL